ncbi:hypothetical protein HOD83_01195 [Candidatus Woesearchaeota archaeon]|jgi:hypothetical protein|nr:hypothetical protein [Candidatus Woesearchaeota archaeon]MBT4114483.1 hypothetical protein [Candidatus Woesearchaeota archaeon]MBT4248187.1 hypothetical protein [Candidatus Woesearchaeota archaeon]
MTVQTIQAGNSLEVYENALKNLKAGDLLIIDRLGTDEKVLIQFNSFDPAAISVFDTSAEVGKYCISGKSQQLIGTQLIENTEEKLRFSDGPKQGFVPVDQTVFVDTYLDDMIIGTPSEVRNRFSNAFSRRMKDCEVSGLCRISCFGNSKLSEKE